MNVSIITRDDFAEILCDANILTTLEGPGTGWTYVCEFGGADIIVVTDPMSQGAYVIHPCSQDSESGGSIHDHARASVV